MIPVCLQNTRDAEDSLREIGTDDFVRSELLIDCAGSETPFSPSAGLVTEKEYKVNFICDEFDVSVQQLQGMNPTWGRIKKSSVLRKVWIRRLHCRNSVPSQGTTIYLPILEVERKLLHTRDIHFFMTFRFCAGEP